jgi:hypothetical protein
MQSDAQTNLPGCMGIPMPWFFYSEMQTNAVVVRTNN